MYNEMSIMMIPNGFKIRKKSDVKTFMEECMCKGSSYGLVIRKDFSVRFEKDKDGNVSVMIKQWDLTDQFNPLLEVASTKNNIYEHDVNYYIWHYRKYINAKWFNDKE